MADKPSQDAQELADSLAQSEKEREELATTVRLQAEELEKLKGDVKKLGLRLDAVSAPVTPPGPDPVVDPIPPIVPPIPPAVDLPDEGRAVPTFHCVGLYLNPPSNPGVTGIKVEYKKASSGVWLLGHPLWYDVRNSEARGSIVHLDPNTDYDVRFSMPGAAPYAELHFKTWSEIFPEASVTRWGNGVETVPRTITAGGSAATGYAVYTSPVGGRTTIRIPTTQNTYPIRVTTSYVIIRGVTTEGGRDAILVNAGCHHVIVEDCDISKWGRLRPIVTPEGWQLGQDRDSGVKIGREVTKDMLTSNIIIQRCKIHDPAYGTNSWSQGHPLGPVGINFIGSSGQHIVRYNDIYSTNPANWFKDGIGGQDNFSDHGAPGFDSDYYKNRIENCWDDAISPEGANRNVRVWGNYMDQVTVPLATTPVFIGPCYLWRNVMNRQRHFSHVPHDADQRNKAFKAYTEGSWGGGARYIYHNTCLQMTGASAGVTASSGLGCGEALAGPMSMTKSRNNIFQVWKSSSNSIRQGFGPDPLNAHECDFNYDLRNGGLRDLPTGSEANVGNTAQVPIYKAGHGPNYAHLGMVQLDATSPGHDEGEVIPNFNDGFLGVAPDVGAHEEGSPAMEWGVTATGS